MNDPTINTVTSIQVLRQAYMDRVLKTIIPRNTDIRDAHFNKQDFFAFNPRAKSKMVEQSPDLSRSRAH